MDERVTDLEIRFMEQQKIIDELDTIVCQQANRIDTLQRELSQIKELLKSYTPSINRTADEEEPPPHY